MELFYGIGFGILPQSQLFIRNTSKASFSEIYSRFLPLFFSVRWRLILKARCVWQSKRPPKAILAHLLLIFIRYGGAFLQGLSGLWFPQCRFCSPKFRYEVFSARKGAYWEGAERICSLMGVAGMGFSLLQSGFCYLEEGICRYFLGRFQFNGVYGRKIKKIFA